jgi:Spy/CpxP family protein refolding chaperone
LHDKLKLTPAQEPAWKTFAERMQPLDRPARPDRAELEKMSAPERMERALAMMKEHEKRMTDRLAAVKEFYAVLTPEQQKVFNDEFAHPRHRRGGPR